MGKLKARDTSFLHGSIAAPTDVISCSAVAEPHGGLSKMRLVGVDGSFGKVCFLTRSLALYEIKPPGRGHGNAIFRHSLV